MDIYTLDKKKHVDVALLFNSIKKGSIYLNENGFTNKQIAEILNSTYASVSWYISKNKVPIKEKIIPVIPDKEFHIKAADSLNTIYDKCVYLYAHLFSINDIVSIYGYKKTTVNWYICKYKKENVKIKAVSSIKLANTTDNIKKTTNLNLPICNKNKKLKEKPINYNKKVNEQIQDLAVLAINELDIDKRKSILNELIPLIIPKLKFHIYKFIKDEDTACDVLSNVLEKIAINFHTYNQQFRFSTWIFTIARNESLLYIQSTKNLVSIDYEYDYGDAIKTDGESDIITDLFSKKMEFYDAYKLILNTLYNLPDSVNKSIFIDKQINNMKGLDLAEKYKLNLNTIKTKIRKVKADIRTIIQKSQPELYNEYIIK